MPAKKYKLFKNNESSDGGPPPCAFFFSPQGCRNGDNCKFSHKLPSEDKASTLVEDSSDVVSSESEDETPPPQPQSKKVKQKATPDKPTTPKTKTPNNNKANATPKPKTPAPNESNKKRKRQDNETKEAVVDTDLGLFSKPKKRAMETKDVQANKATPKSKDTQAKHKATPKSKGKVTPMSSTPKKEAERSVPDFRALNLPIASFNTETGKVEHSKPSQTQNEEDSSTKEDPKPKYPLPKSTPEGLIWQKAVVNTRLNERYESIYDFDKMKANDEENGIIKGEDWVKARPFGAWCVKNPHAIAIDCEMCETKDPVSGKSDHKALCRLSVVNAVNPDEVLIDTLVKPTWPVVDYRTRINGISKESLDSVEFTLQHAQAFMMALCSEETVIIGHALHNDLVALKMEHYCNADSALLFKSKDPEARTCSLKDLAKSVTGNEMPDVHCSINDARTALICLRDGYLNKDCKPELVERSPKAPPRFSAELFVHRIPKGCKPDHIKNMFLAYTSITPVEVPEISFGASSGKTTVSFSTPEHANLAFKTFDSEAKPDATGRMQKRIYLSGGGYACVRKMTNERKKKAKEGTVEKVGE